MDARKNLRYASFVLRELRWPLGLAFVIVLAGGALLSASLGKPYGKACYTVFMLMLGEPTDEFPDRLAEQVLFFALPVIGLGALADSVVRLGYLVFSSKRKLEEWWIMEASSMSGHVVLCGLGRVGYRVARELLEIRQPFVAIERNKDSSFAAELLDLGVPVLFGEVRLRQTLEKANVAKAKSVILATDDDLANLDAALTAREIRPEIPVVMRLFDDTLAQKVATAFKLPAISTSQVAAPAFVAAATGRAVLHTFQLGGTAHHVADLDVAGLAGRTEGQVQKEFGASVLVHRGEGPDPERPLTKGDRIVVVAPPGKLRALEEANRA